MGLLSDHCYVKEGATWLKTTEYGDDKDRVLVKSDGQSTYFLPDIAYHNIKLSRGYNKIFNIWGADHTSYADRMNIAMKILGHNPDKLVTLIMQMVRLVKDGKEFKMSKRSGNSLTLDDLVKAIGKEPARWYLVSQPMSSHLEIDVDKATNNNNNNPLYYVQYAHARINQILSKIERVNLPKNFDLLTSDIEREIIVNLHSYVTTIRKIASSYEVNILTIYLYNLAKLFHSYYASNKIIDLNNMELTKQRYWFVFCIKTVIANVMIHWIFFLMKKVLRIFILIKQKLQKTLSLEVTPYQWYEALASEFVVKVGANLLWECRNMISTINIQDLQADIFTYSDYNLAVLREEYPGITIKGTYAEDFKARFPNDAETSIFWFDCYRKLLIG